LSFELVLLGLETPVSAVGRARQESCLDQHAQQSLTRLHVKAPQTASLIGRQLKTGHLEELATKASDQIHSRRLHCLLHDALLSDSTKPALYRLSWCVVQVLRPASEADEQRPANHLR
jgi:hypothetical protein